MTMPNHHAFDHTNGRRKEDRRREQLPIDGPDRRKGTDRREVADRRQGADRRQTVRPAHSDPE